MADNELLTVDNYPKLFGGVEFLKMRIQRDFPDREMPKVWVVDYLPASDYQWISFGIGPGHIDIPKENALQVENGDFSQYMEAMSIISHEMGHAFFSSVITKADASLSIITECKADHMALYYGYSDALQNFLVKRGQEQYQLVQALLPLDIVDESELARREDEIKFKLRRSLLGEHPFGEERIAMLQNEELKAVLPGSILFNEDCTVKGILPPGPVRGWEHEQEEPGKTLNKPVNAAPKGRGGLGG